MQTGNKSLTEIQQILTRKGVKGFVVKANANRVTLLVDRKDIEMNRRKWNGR